MAFPETSKQSQANAKLESRAMHLVEMEIEFISNISSALMTFALLTD